MPRREEKSPSDKTSPSPSLARRGADCDTLNKCLLPVFDPEKHGRTSRPWHPPHRRAKPALHSYFVGTLAFNSSNQLNTKVRCVRSASFSSFAALVMTKRCPSGATSKRGFDGFRPD